LIDCLIDFIIEYCKKHWGVRVAARIDFGFQLRLLE
jgi:hypothetical protein